MDERVKLAEKEVERERERKQKKRGKEEPARREIVFEKNEWLYLSVIKTAAKNKQTRGNKPCRELSDATQLLLPSLPPFPHDSCPRENSNKRLR